MGKVALFSQVRAPICWHGKGPISNFPTARKVFNEADKSLDSHVQNYALKVQEKTARNC